MSNIQVLIELFAKYSKQQSGSIFHVKFPMFPLWDLINNGLPISNDSPPELMILRLTQLFSLWNFSTSAKEYINEFYVTNAEFRHCALTTGMLIQLEREPHPDGGKPYTIRRFHSAEAINMMDLEAFASIEKLVIQSFEGNSGLIFDLWGGVGYTIPSWVKIMVDPYVYQPTTIICTGECEGDKIIINEIPLGLNFSLLGNTTLTYGVKGTNAPQTMDAGFCTEIPPKGPEGVVTWVGIELFDKFEVTIIVPFPACRFDILNETIFSGKKSGTMVATFSCC